MGWDNFNFKIKQIFFALNIAKSDILANFFLQKNFNILIYYKMLFQKLKPGLGTPLFTKQNAKTHSDLFRKGYHTVEKSRRVLTV